MKKYLLGVWAAFRGNAKMQLKLAVKQLDNMEPVLADMIRQNMNPDKVAKLVIDKVQEELDRLIEKNF